MLLTEEEASKRRCRLAKMSDIHQARNDAGLEDRLSCIASGCMWWHTHELSDQEKLGVQTNEDAEIARKLMSKGECTYPDGETLD